MPIKHSEHLKLGMTSPLESPLGSEFKLSLTASQVAVAREEGLRVQRQRRSYAQKVCCEGSRSRRGRRAYRAGRRGAAARRTGRGRRGGLGLAPERPGRLADRRHPGPRGVPRGRLRRLRPARRGQPGPRHRVRGRHPRAAHAHPGARLHRQRARLYLVEHLPPGRRQPRLPGLPRRHGRPGAEHRLHGTPAHRQPGHRAHGAAVPGLPRDPSGRPLHEPVQRAHPRHPPQQRHLRRHGRRLLELPLRHHRRRQPRHAALGRGEARGVARHRDRLGRQPDRHL